MGKSNKKIKNDRINTVRKQYDAFLEEDKKRRERNEYILGKLDKMRSTNALVPISNKGNYHVEHNPTEIFMRPSNLRPKPELRDSYITQLEKQNATASVLNNPMDELRVLKEISKKYILIPKRTPIENDYINSRDIYDEDWKSKYNILDDLKKLEKEGQSDPVCEQYNDNYMHNKGLKVSVDSNNFDKQPHNIDNDIDNIDEPICDTNTELTVQKLMKSPTEQKTTEQNILYVPEINSYESEKTKVPLEIANITTNEGLKDDHNQLAYNTKQECKINPQEDVTYTENEKYSTESNEKDLHLAHKFNNSSEISESTDVTHSAIYQENVNESDYVSANATKKSVSPENIDEIRNIAVSEQTIIDEKPQELCANELSGEIINLDQNIDNQQYAFESQDLTSTEKSELYNKENNPESQVVSDETDIEKTNYYDPVQNTIPVDPEDNQKLDHGEHESQINAFEAEQKEMFYSEQSHGETYAYNQDESNTGAYTEGYGQNDQYAYYEGVQEEQAYATNINEHEESTERYDPHYNEQYEQNYQNQQPDKTVAYDNTNAYQQQQFQDENPQFENVTNYENQQQSIGNENESQGNMLPPQDIQMYDQHLYVEQPDVQEQIEQQLVSEEGYTESPSVIANEFKTENEEKIENVTDITTPEAQILDPKLS